jgi:hypothetical protein
MIMNGTKPGVSVDPLRDKFIAAGMPDVINGIPKFNHFGKSERFSKTSAKSWNN